MEVVLRRESIACLATAKVLPKVAQALARHSTITLTMDRYTHLGMGDLVEALGRLTGLSSTFSNSTAARTWETSVNWELKRF